MSKKRTALIGLSIILVLIAFGLTVQTYVPEIWAGATSESVENKGSVVSLSNRLVFLSIAIALIGETVLIISILHAFNLERSTAALEQQSKMIQFLDEWHSAEMDEARQDWYEMAKKIESNANNSFSIRSAGCKDTDHAKTDKPIQWAGSEKENQKLMTTVFVLVNFFEKNARLFEAKAFNIEVLHTTFRDYALWYRRNFLDVVERIDLCASRLKEVNRVSRIRRFLKAAERK